MKLGVTETRIARGREWVIIFIFLFFSLPTGLGQLKVSPNWGNSLTQHERVNTERSFARACMRAVPYATVLGDA